METIITYLIEKSPLFAVAAVALMVGWWAFKFYNRMVRTEKEVINVQTDLVKTDDKILAFKTELKADIINMEIKLKENDFFHLGKALLLIGAEVLKNNPERFERVKDTILDTTPDTRRDEIKSITL